MGQIAQVIKYEGDNTTFVWKHPLEDFNSMTQLIVHESQEAVFMMNGQALDLFGAGRYTLQTQNIPLLGRILNRITGDKSPFHAEVYFVNKAEQMAVKWGTDSKIQFLEPTYGFPLSIGAYGEMSLRAEDSKRLLIKIVGTENSLSQENLTRFFRAFVVTRVKSYLAQIIREEKISIFEIDERLQSLSARLLALLQPDFLDYGVALERFFVMAVSKPDGEPQYEKFKSLHFRSYADVMEARLRQQVGVIDAQTEAQKKVIESQALAQKRAQEGYTFQQERAYEVAEQAARNEGVGQYTNLGIGLGTMAGVGGMVAGFMNGGMQEAMNGMMGGAPSPQPKAVKCKQCGAEIPAGAKFCPACGGKAEEDETVVCPNCGKTVPKAKFCAECGHKFATVCPKCGAEVKGGKFCPECGEKL